jgi:hypothetical protein
VIQAVCTTCSRCFCKYKPSHTLSLVSPSAPPKQANHEHENLLGTAKNLPIFIFSYRYRQQHGGLATAADTHYNMDSIINTHQHFITRSSRRNVSSHTQHNQYDNYHHYSIQHQQPNKTQRLPRQRLRLRQFYQAEGQNRIQDRYDTMTTRGMTIPETAFNTNNRTQTNELPPTLDLPSRTAPSKDACTTLGADEEND